MILRTSTGGLVLKETRHVVAMLRLLVLAGLVLLGVSHMPERPFLFWLVTSIYGATIFGYLWANQREYDLLRIKWMIFLFDVVVVSMLIILRGDQVQHFLTAYFTLVLIAAIVDGLGSAIFNAILVSVLYLALTQWSFKVEELLKMETLGQCVFFFIVSLFMGHVAQTAREDKLGRAQAEAEREQAEEALEQTSSELRQSAADLREAREALRANDHLFTLGMLSAGIAHEMKNPIAAILASVEEAPSIVDDLASAMHAGEDTGPLLEEVRDVVRDCDEACRQLQRVVLDLNDMVRGGTSQVCSVDPEESLQGAARMLRKATGDAIHLQVACAARGEVQADPGRLLQVLLNLAKNGIDAMRENRGDTLVLAAEDGPGARVQFIIRDNGPGIPEHVMARMYEPFFTTKGPGQGTGLGLHLVSEIVKSQKGTIMCESNAEDGTEFRVSFPARPSSERLESPNDHQDDASHRGRRGDHPQGAAAHAA